MKLKTHKGLAKRIKVTKNGQAQEKKGFPFSFIIQKIKEEKEKDG